MANLTQGAVFRNFGWLLHDGCIVAGPECGVNPSPGLGRWGNGTAWSLRSWGNGNRMKLMATLKQSIGVLQVTGFQLRALNQFQISNHFFFVFVSRIIPRKVQCLYIHLQLIDSIDCLPRRSGGFCWSLENYWRFQAESGGSFEHGQGLSSLETYTVPWVAMDWLPPNMDGNLDFQEGIDVIIGF